MVETEKEIMDTLRSRQKRWIGHITRPHDSLLKTFSGQIQGKKGCGRPRAMFLDCILTTIGYEEKRRWHN